MEIDVNGKGTKIPLPIGLITKKHKLMSEFFPKPKPLWGEVKVELDWSNSLTKPDFKNSTVADTSKFTKKVDLASLRLGVDKLDIEKLEKVSTGLNTFKTIVDKLDVKK